MTSERRLNLVDGMIFVATTACGLAVPRAWMTSVVPIRKQFWASPASWREALTLAILDGLEASFPVLLTTTLAILAIRLRQPRPRLLRLAREPGFMACIVAALAVLLGVAFMIPLVLARGVWFAEAFALLSYTREGGSAVMGAWLVLAMGRRWRPQAHWVDRLGRLVGVDWIGANALRWLTYVLIVR
jgi:hypothetical protein